MSERTGISWCDSTFNPWYGCTKVSPACDHCYAERLMDKRMHSVQWGAGKPRVRTSAENWRQPLRWNAKRFMQCEDCGWRGEADAELVGCGACGSIELSDTRRRVFCAALADVFDNEVDEAWRQDLFRLILKTPHLDWLVLTKRIGNARSMLASVMCQLDPRGKYPFPLPNVWLGATICNQDEADRDVPKLLATPAAVRFLSVEPMLGPITLPSMRCDHGSVPGPGGAGGVTCTDCGGCGDRGNSGCLRLHWVICGGESGPHARPMHPDWVRSLRDQCAAAGVAFHFKRSEEHTSELQ